MWSTCRTASGEVGGGRLTFVDLATGAREDQRRDAELAEISNLVTRGR